MSLSRKILSSYLLALLPVAVHVQNAEAQSVLNLLEKEISDLCVEARPAVVTISAVASGEMMKKPDKGFFPFLSEAENTGIMPKIRVGSGLIVTADGFIITRYSVVENAEAVFVTIHGNRQHQAEVIGSDSLASIAVLRVTEANLKPARLSIAGDMAPGSWVMVIGNSMGMPHSISVGILNGIHQEGMMQVSASVDPGNSGSPVFNSKGDAIGLIAAVVNYEKDDHPRGNGYFGHSTLVSPISYVLSPLRRLIDNYYAQHGWLGVTVNRDPLSPQGAHIVHLDEGGPGKKAGMRIDDVITHFNGHPLKSITDLRNLVLQRKPGEKVEVGLLRQATPMQLDIEIGRRRGEDVLKIVSPERAAPRIFRTNP